MTEPRPRKLTPEMSLNAAKRVVADLVRQEMVAERLADQYARDIARVGRRHMDGYELAKELDDRHHWDCNLRMAEELDGFSSEADREIAAAEKAWAAKEGIVPPLPVTTRVTFGNGEAGEITGIYEHGTAKYMIRVDGDQKALPPTNSRRIVNFEDVSELARTAAA